MKRVLFSTIAVLMAALVVNAQPPAGDAKTGDWYGEKITADGAENIADVAAKLEKTESVDGKIRAKIVDVCPKKGCWLKLQVNDSTTAMVKMKDYAFFLPVSAKGKTVVLDGEVKMKTTSVAELRHYAEDAKKSKEEIAAITKPEKEIRVTAKGIVVVE
jgi:DNA-directed RNA polymerase subunit F